MTILAVDTSSLAASCAIMRDGILAGEFYTNNGLTHSQTIMPMLRALLDSARLELRDVDVFAVSTGPGSFTGLRIGISAVKGMALALDKPCAAVPTLHALALNAAAFDGFITPVMDARRNQVYSALFRCEASVVRRLSEDQAIPVPDLCKILSDLAPDTVMLTGDGAHLCTQSPDAPGNLCQAPEGFLHQRAGCVAKAALEIAQAGMLVSADDLVPSYLRLPQAERERLGFC